MPVRSLRRTPYLKDTVKGRQRQHKPFFLITLHFRWSAQCDFTPEAMAWDLFCSAWFSVSRTRKAKHAFQSIPSRRWS